MFKGLKYFVVMMFVLVGVAVAQDAVVTAPTDTPALPFNLWVLVQQLLTNGGMMLIAFMAGKLPGGVGVWLRKVIDVFAANISHTKYPTVK